MIDLVAGRTPLTAAGTPPLPPHVKSGRVGSTPKEYADFITLEQARWSNVVRKAHIEAN